MELNRILDYTDAQWSQRRQRRFVLLENLPQVVLCGKGYGIFGGVLANVSRNGCCVFLEGEKAHDRILKMGFLEDTLGNPLQELIAVRVKGQLISAGYLKWVRQVEKGCGLGIELTLPAILFDEGVRSNVLGSFFPVQADIA